MDTYSLSHTHTHLHTHTHTYTRRSYVSFSKYRQRIVSLVFPTLRKLKNPETVGLISPGIQIYVVHVCIHYVFTNVRTLSSPLHARARAHTHTHTHTHTAIKMRLKSSAKHVASLLAARSSMSLSSTPPCTPPMSAPVRTAPMLESSPGSQG